MPTLHVICPLGAPGLRRFHGVAGGRMSGSWSTLDIHVHALPALQEEAATLIAELVFAEHEI